MNTFNKLFLTTVALTALVATGCVPGDDTNVDGSSSATDTNGTDDATATMTMTATMTQGTVDTGTDTTPTTMTDSATGTDTATDTDTETGTTGPDPNDYDFREDDPTAYTQVDRKGFPAINTALIAPENKDAYNAASPVDDVNGNFEGNIEGSLNFLHRGIADDNNTGLDDDLAVLPDPPGALEPCRAPVLSNDTCAAQLGPFVYPDVLLIDTNATAGFPNGRQLDAPVMDIILAVLLLELADEAIDTFAAIPLNPAANDLEFNAAFPYLAAPHE